MTEMTNLTIPRHVAIVMDGNGRWAAKQGLPRHAGHRAGVKSVKKVVETCARQGVEWLTLFAFSSENWRRPQQEVNMLMQLFLTSLKGEIRRLHKNNIRLSFIGERSAFETQLQAKIAEAEELTASNTGLQLIIAANYGGRWDITQGVKRIARLVEAGDLSVEAITPERFDAELSLAGTPDPDLFIRTGGEQRISNFLLWQLAYTELYFTEVLWPDFDEEALLDALQCYSRRQRRFGQTGEQVELQKRA
ncbi:MAG: isoprenyl transferase [Gammaproteobacteria bacterium]